MTSVLDGGCACGKVRYELHGTPLIVHACHCVDCRRLAGSAFGVNVWTEAENVVLTSGKLQTAMLAGGASGKPHECWFCGDCGTSVWSRYHAAPGDCRFVRAGTLDDPANVQPDVHIYTRSKLAWCDIPKGAESFDAFYDLKKIWRPESRERLRKNIEKSG